MQIALVSLLFDTTSRRSTANTNGYRRHTTQQKDFERTFQDSLRTRTSSSKSCCSGSDIVDSGCLLDAVKRVILRRGELGGEKQEVAVAEQQRRKDLEELAVAEARRRDFTALELPVTLTQLWPRGTSRIVPALQQGERSCIGDRVKLPPGAPYMHTALPDALHRLAVPNQASELRLTRGPCDVTMLPCCSKRVQVMRAADEPYEMTAVN